MSFLFSLNFPKQNAEETLTISFLHVDEWVLIRWADVVKLCAVSSLQALQQLVFAINYFLNAGFNKQEKKIA